MPLPFLPGLLAGLGSAATAVASNPLAQQAALGAGSYVAQGLGDRLSNWWNGPQAPQAPGPEQQAQQYYLNQIQQPVNIPYQAQQQQMMNQFNQQLIPGIAERFSGAGGQRSSAFGQQLGAGGADLMQALEALREQSQLQEANINQGRLGQLGGYLGGQQQLGLQAQQLGQQGAIANREAQLRAMGLMAQQNQFQQGQNLQQLLGRGELQGRLAGLGLGRQFDILRHGGAPANIGGVVRGIGQGVQLAGQLF
ncbi:hypothetical protein [Methylobacter sp.]|uniref:hypothetical protein n=1 Tax=Methylobacter sp. TaxID=2051955 RepID=UPI003DA3D823